MSKVPDLVKDELNRCLKDFAKTQENVLSVCRLKAEFFCAISICDEDNNFLTTLDYCSPGWKRKDLEDIDEKERKQIIIYEVNENKK